MKKALLRMALFQQNCSKPHFLKLYGDKRGEKLFQLYESLYNRNLLSLWADELSEEEQDIMENYIANLPMKELLKKKPR